ncbi:MAG: hypothetical protein GY710_23980, partial [Desulfobacteraceae bacterium]|nr:hypothetical protein [Desulfobacteraceae bacterium]
MDEKVTLKINGAAINFNVTADIHERLIDEMNPANKIAPMHNFLIRAVESESKEALDPFL